MLAEESIWIKNCLKEDFSDRDFPLLNIGSSTAEFRKTGQPHIYENIFRPLSDAGKAVIHTDIKKDDGVDLVGDLNDSSFRKTLKEKNVKSVLCSNLLEHLEDPRKICDSILDILNKGDLIVVTVPHSFPYHKDPIDTMLRPSINQLHAFFPGTEILKSEIVTANNSYKNDLLNNKRYLRIMIARWLMPFYKFNEWKFMIGDLFRSGRKYSAACLLLRKTN